MVFFSSKYFTAMFAFSLLFINPNVGPREVKYHEPNFTEKHVDIYAGWFYQITTNTNVRIYYRSLLCWAHCHFLSTYWTFYKSPKKIISDPYSPASVRVLMMSLKALDKAAFKVCCIKNTK